MNLSSRAFLAKRRLKSFLGVGCMKMLNGVYKYIFFFGSKVISGGGASCF